MASPASTKPPRPRRIATPAPTVSVPGIPALPAAARAVISAMRDGVPMVSIADTAPVAALVLSHLSAEQVAAAHRAGTPVLVVGLAGDALQPVIIGIFGAGAPPSATVDGRRVELTGQDEVVLTCGKASITLTKAGKVIIKGTYVSTASTGVQRITGGSVQIN
jgi:hypothetical protein